MAEVGQAWQMLPQDVLPSSNAHFVSVHLASKACVAAQGVPIRLELGPKDMEAKSVMLARRDTGAKETVPWSDVISRVPQLLDQIQVSF